MLVPRLGVAMTFSLIIAGQMIVTLVIDHFGLLGVPVKEVSLAADRRDSADNGGRCFDQKF